MSSGFRFEQPTNEERDMSKAARFIGVWDYALSLARRAWVVLKHRSFLVCPFCKGSGGEVSGYYEPEWSECATCFKHYEEFDDHGMQWFVGRLPLIAWIRAKASIRFGLWYSARFRDLLACKFGRHRWMDEGPDGDSEKRLHICATCYRSKYIHPDGTEEMHDIEQD
jgi:hypothetical protein